uniref:(northern house mosquito) hypothetical protein n=1 Tax=Culex pipiens TaxID=7175 RepID=A0A8D8NAW2_CULPI
MSGGEPHPQVSLHAGRIAVDGAKVESEGRILRKVVVQSTRCTGSSYSHEHHTRRTARHRPRSRDAKVSQQCHFGAVEFLHSGGPKVHHRDSTIGHQQDPYSNP